MNNKGDMISLLYVIIIIAVMGIVIFFTNKITYGYETKLQETLNQMPEIDTTNETKSALGNIIQSDKKVYDFAFLGILIGYVILVGIFSYQTPINPIFFWISVILAMFWLFVGTLFSNLWQGIASSPEMASDVARFPIMNALLGTYYPTVVTFIIIVGMIFLFGKPVGGEAR